MVRAMTDPALKDFLLDQIREFICICKGGVVVEMNDAAAKVMGGGKDLFLGRRFAELVHPDFSDALADGLDILTEGPVLMKIQRLDGQTVDAEVEAVPLKDARHLVTVRDVSSRIRIAQEIVDSEDRFRHLVDLITDMVTVWEDGAIVFVNSAGLRLMGAESAAQLTGLKMPDIVHENWREAVDLEGLCREREPLPMKFRRLDGRSLDVEVAVKPFGRDGCYMMDARDVTSARRAAMALRNSEQHLRHILDSVADGIIVIDRMDNVRSLNAAAERIFGYGSSEAAGKPVSLLMQEARPQIAMAWNETGLNADGSHSFVIDHEMIACHRSGMTSAIELTVTELHEGSETFRIGVVRDISEKKRAEERIRHQASHDTLTDLPNRSYFYGRLEQCLAVNKRRNRHGALLMLNIDGFKLVNDTFGLQVGDHLLQAIARRLREHLRTEEFLARLGGDDFVVILPEIAASYEAGMTARRMIDAMAPCFDIEGIEIHVTASVGIALFPQDAADASHLVKNASAALYRAKDQGRSNFSLFTADLNQIINERLNIRNGLIKALEQNEFSLVFQPKVTLANRELSGVEALLRWRSREHGPVSPVKFIPVLEETSMIATVGQWVLETACQQQRDWQDQGMGVIRMAVNLSVRQLRPGLVQMVEKVLDRTGVSPKSLEIEITESLLMRDTDNAVSMLRSLAEMGIELAIDDFGTGYSSLSYLKRLPLNSIKIDRSFITDLVVDSDSTEIVRTIIAMGHSLRRRIVAEGVETAEQLEILTQLGADEVQGYYFSPPIVAEAMVQLLAPGQPFGSPEDKSSVALRAQA